MRLIYSGAALRNIEDIGAYIAQDSLNAAAETQVRLTEACRSLIAFPNVGRLGRRRGTRELVTVRPYVIVYRVQTDAVQIERIVHSARLR